MEIGETACYVFGRTIKNKLMCMCVIPYLDDGVLLVKGALDDGGKHEVKAARVRDVVQAGLKNTPIKNANTA